MTVKSDSFGDEGNVSESSDIPETENSDIEIQKMETQNSLSTFENELHRYKYSCRGIIDKMTKRGVSSPSKMFYSNRNERIQRLDIVTDI